MPEPNPTQPKSLEYKSPFKTLKDVRGTFGVFEDYPNADEILAGIAQNSTRFIEEKSTGPGGNRIKFFLTLKDGQAIDFMVKAKPLNRVANFRYPRTPVDVNENRLVSSVLNELIANKKAQERYKKEYGEELPIEKPVGFYISTQDGHKGEKWVIFEKLQPIIRGHEIPYELLTSLREKREKYAQEMQKKLAKIGIITNAGALEKDMVFVGDKDKPKSIKLVIVDSEGWGIRNPK